MARNVEYLVCKWGGQMEKTEKVHRRTSELRARRWQNENMPEESMRKCDIMLWGFWWEAEVRCQGSTQEPMIHHRSGESSQHLKPSGWSGALRQDSPHHHSRPAPLLRGFKCAAQAPCKLA
mmetsp:Transcript_17143/g.51815  ORF Transcript_17143/g.51815 Transcript_17143/m.51815 type:complete len:121 (+) Transcript_17143:1042-1404(+)|eukprot:scaffold45006_cov29-Tisochrysis_lutea.AAC.8